VTAQPEIGTPLQATIGLDRMPMGTPAVTDARNACAQVVAAYLKRLAFTQENGDKPRSDWRLIKVLTNWPEPNIDLEYPSASIDEAGVNYEAHNLVPTMQPETENEFCHGTVLWKTDELACDFQVDFWLNTEVQRDAVSAALPRFFNLSEQRAGVMLAGSPEYYHRPVRASLMSADRVDDSATVLNRERRLRVILRVEVDVVHLRTVRQLQPVISVDVEE